MNRKSIVLITKDAFCASYLPAYGNKYWKGKTPNIDELAQKGVVYTRYYTAAPSTSMAFLSMFTGKFPYQQDIKKYVPVNEFIGETLFDKANKLGFESHIIWDETYINMAYKYSKCYGQNTTIHSMCGLLQRVGVHCTHPGVLMPDSAKAEQTLDMIDKEIASIVSGSNKVFLWIHIPHVINGRVCYGSDIDLFDFIIGLLRKYFADDCIFISADHGNMNGHKGKLGYGFDVCDTVTRIPLITPKKENSVDSDTLLCNVDIYSIIFGEPIPKRELLFLDSAYYAQNNRNLGILYEHYKYVYHKKTKTEELFDLDVDPNEEFNLIRDKFFDVDRKVYVPSREEFFYEKWDELSRIRAKVREAKKQIWRDSTITQKLVTGVKDFLRPLKISLTRKRI